MHVVSRRCAALWACRGASLPPGTQLQHVLFDGGGERVSPRAPAAVASHGAAFLRHPPPPFPPPTDCCFVHGSAFERFVADLRVPSGAALWSATLWSASLRACVNPSV